MQRTLSFAGIALLIFSAILAPLASAGTITETSTDRDYAETFETFAPTQTPGDSWYVQNTGAGGGTATVVASTAFGSTRAWQVSDTGAATFSAQLQNTGLGVNICTAGQVFVIKFDVSASLLTGQSWEIRLSSSAPVSTTQPADSLGVIVAGQVGTTPEQVSIYVRGSGAAVTPQSISTSYSAGTVVTVTIDSVNCFAGAAASARFTFAGALTGTFTYVSTSLMTAATEIDRFTIASISTTLPTAAILADDYQWNNAPLPAPVITNIQPAGGTNEGGDEVTITVSNLKSPATVRFDTTDATVVSQTATEIVVETPPHADGLVDVTVTNPDGQFDTATNGYLYQCLIPGCGGATANFLEDFDDETIGQFPAEDWYEPVGVGNCNTSAAQSTSAPNSGACGAEGGFYFTDSEIDPCSAQITFSMRLIAGSQTTPLFIGLGNPDSVNVDRTSGNEGGFVGISFVNPRATGTSGGFQLAQRNSHQIGVASGYTSIDGTAFTGTYDTDIWYPISIIVDCSNNSVEVTAFGRTESGPAMGVSRNDGNAPITAPALVWYNPNGGATWPGMYIDDLRISAIGIPGIAPDVSVTVSSLVGFATDKFSGAVVAARVDNGQTIKTYNAGDLSEIAAFTLDAGCEGHLDGVGAFEGPRDYYVTFYNCDGAGVTDRLHIRNSQLQNPSLPAICADGDFCDIDFEEPLADNCGAGIDLPIRIPERMQNLGQLNFALWDYSQNSQDGDENTRVTSSDRVNTASVGWAFTDSDSRGVGVLSITMNNNAGDCGDFEEITYSPGAPARDLCSLQNVLTGRQAIIAIGEAQTRTYVGDYSYQTNPASQGMDVAISAGPIGQDPFTDMHGLSCGQNYVFEDDTGPNPAGCNDFSGSNPPRRVCNRGVVALAMGTDGTVYATEPASAQTPYSIRWQAQGEQLFRSNVAVSMDGKWGAYLAPNRLITVVNMLDGTPKAYLTLPQSGNCCIEMEMDFSGQILYAAGNNFIAKWLIKDYTTVVAVAPGVVADIQCDTVTGSCEIVNGQCYNSLGLPTGSGQCDNSVDPDGVRTAGGNAPGSQANQPAPEAGTSKATFFIWIAIIAASAIIGGLVSNFNGAVAGGAGFIGVIICVFGFGMPPWVPIVMGVVGLAIIILRSQFGGSRAVG